MNKKDGEPKTAHGRIVKYHVTCRKKGSPQLSKEARFIRFTRFTNQHLKLTYSSVSFCSWCCSCSVCSSSCEFEFNYLPHLLPISIGFVKRSKDFLLFNIHSILAKSHHSRVIHNHQLSSVSFLCLLPSFSSSRTSADKSSWHVKWHSNCTAWEVQKLSCWH